MAQVSYRLNGAGGGLGIRLGVEAAFEAIASSNSGPTEPPRTFPYMSWADTAANLMKQRNPQNTGWIIVGPLDKPAYGLGDQVGDFKISARSSIDNYLRCTFQEVSRSTYSLLFAEIGIQFGPGNGTTTFNLPGPQGRALVFGGAGEGLTNRDIGNRYGAETHSLTEAQNGPHAHAIHDPGHGHVLTTAPKQVRNTTSDFSQTGTHYSSGGPGPTMIAATNGTGIGIHVSGAGQAHNNLQPSIVIGHLWIRAIP